GSDGPGGQLLAYRETPEGLTASLLAWLPPEVSVRPTHPAVAPVGVYAGQVFVGDMEGGGIRRVYLDQVADGSQGVVFEFTQGLEAGVNRLLFAADGSLIAGGAGGSAAFGELGKPGYGLQRLRPNGRSVFEMLAVRARANGLEIELTEPLAERQGWDAAAYRVRSYRYEPETATATDERREAVVSASVGADRRRIFLELPDLEPRRVIELRLPRGLRSDAGQPLWSTGAWYSLLRRGERPGEVLPSPEGLQPNTLTTAERQAGWRLLFDGESTAAWRGFRRKEFPARGWTVEAGTLHLSAGGGDLVTVEQFANFEFSLEWKASPGANSGLMYRVTEEVSPSWASGIEVQILDDRGTDALHSAAAAYELYPPENKTLHPAGEWNQLTLVVRGSQVEHWLNGNRVVAYDLASDDFRARVAASKFRTMPRFGKEPRGHLVIQDHGNEFWFRNLKIRVLD
ncbi:MAG: DUF1080 domain-containing protein, partial [Armatimonadetes bacterium]|nr:DUF1080 domain-containing protein [Armatimonadota bacterium]